MPPARPRRDHGPGRRGRAAVIYSEGGSQRRRGATRGRSDRRGATRGYSENAGRTRGDRAQVRRRSACVGSAWLSRCGGGGGAVGTTRGRSPGRRRGRSAGAVGRRRLRSGLTTKSSLLSPGTYLRRQRRAPTRAREASAPRQSRAAATTTPRGPRGGFVKAPSPRAPRRRRGGAAAPARRRSRSTCETLDGRVPA